MAVAFDAKTVAHFATTSNAATTDITNLTVGTGSNRVLVVCIANNNADVGVTSLTWDQGGTNQAMTLITANTTTRYLGWYGLVAPTSGNKTLRLVTTTTLGNLLVDAISFTGADQTGGTTTFYGAVHQFSGAAIASPASITISSFTGDMCCAVHEQDTQAWSATSGTTIYTDSSLNIINGAANRDVGATSVALTASWTGGGTAFTFDAGFAIKASTAGAGTTQKSISMTQAHSIARVKNVGKGVIL